MVISQRASTNPEEGKGQETGRRGMQAAQGTWTDKHMRRQMHACMQTAVKHGMQESKKLPRARSNPKERQTLKGLTIGGRRDHVSHHPLGGGSGLRYCTLG